MVRALLELTSKHFINYSAKTEIYSLPELGLKAVFAILWS
jgi:hypothetical protein